MLSSRDSRGQFATLTASGINAVIDSPDQIVHFARANLGFCIIERNSAAKAVLWMFQPGPRLVDVPKDVCRMLKQSRIPQNLVGFVRRQPPGAFSSLQR